MEQTKSLTEELVEIAQSEVFPTCNAAMQWVKEHYSNTDYRIKYRIMHGVGTRAIVYMMIAYKLELK